MVFNQIKRVLHQTVQVRGWMLILCSILFFGLSSYVVYYLEPGNFENPFNGFWYVMTTVSQVGYGDYTPQTPLGRIYAVALYVLGIGLFGVVVAKWVDAALQFRQRKEEGKLRYYGKDHIVIVHGSPRARSTIKKLLLDEAIRIVIIDTLPTSPFLHSRVHYVQGQPTDESVLAQANILQASAIGLFASDAAADEVGMDGRTLLIGSSLRQVLVAHDREVYTVAEVANESHARHFRNLGINDVVLSNQPFSKIMTQSVLENGD